MSLLREITTELKEYNNFLEAVQEAIVQLLDRRHGEAVFTDGQINILEQPEFREVENAKRVLTCLLRMTLSEVCFWIPWMSGA